MQFHSALFGWRLLFIEFEGSEKADADGVARETSLMFGRSYAISRHIHADEVALHKRHKLLLTARSLRWRCFRASKVG